MIFEMLGSGAVLAPRHFREAGVTNEAVRRLHESGGIHRIESMGGHLLGYALRHDAGPVDTKQDKMAEIAVRHPNAVLCLRSALRYHGMTDDFQDTYQAAVPQGASRRPTVLGGCVLVAWTDPARFSEGVDTVSLGGVPARVTSAARTVADIFEPRLKDFSEGRIRALRMLADTCGDAALSEAARFARALGWAAELDDPIATLRESANATFHR